MALLVPLRERGPARAALVAGPALLLGVAVWGGGLVATPHFPEYAHGHGGGVGFTAGPGAVDTYDWQLPAGFPPPYVPPNNPMTAEKVALGRFLFYDERLSANGTQSCATCHRQELAFSDGRATALGSTGEAHPRNAQGLANVAYNSTLTWGNPSLTALEDQILIPMFGEFPKELAITGHEAEVLARLRDDARYRQLFGAAFPGEAEPIDWGNITRALASFSRTLISGSSPYDRYVYGGDKSAMSPSAVRGLDLFLSEKFECHHCHGGYNFTGSTRDRGTVFVEAPFHNTGLYNLGGTGAYPRGNTGVHEITGRAEDTGRFRAPSLRNVALTAPYMHDGSVATLEEVLRLYAAGGRQIADGPLAGDGRANPYKSGFVPGFTLTEQERQDMLAFLNALTDEQFIRDPRFADPFTATATATAARGAPAQPWMPLLSLLTLPCAYGIGALSRGDRG